MTIGTAEQSTVGDRLAPHHLADLRASGLTDETILWAGLRTIHDPVEIGRRLGATASEASSK